MGPPWTSSMENVIHTSSSLETPQNIEHSVVFPELQRITPPGRSTAGISCGRTFCQFLDGIRYTDQASLSGIDLEEIFYNLQHLHECQRQTLLAQLCIPCLTQSTF
jgi:hypothetical protein